MAPPMSWAAAAVGPESSSADAKRVTQSASAGTAAVSGVSSPHHDVKVLEVVHTCPMHLDRVRCRVRGRRPVVPFDALPAVRSLRRARRARSG